ncbi:hypothetical protein SLS62_002582 [Diatrype stigma]|uniref:Uncharacterized protein n=1 Tax=Diatrype stigma TaxID=117547 RepID=A0AAN9UXG2_9PEZI
MLDNDFDKEMAALEQSQREANESYARAMDSMAADLSQMSSRFEAEMKAAGSSGSDRPQQQQKQQVKGVREQMAEGGAARGVRQGGKGGGSAKRVG